MLSCLVIVLFVTGADVWIPPRQERLFWCFELWGRDSSEGVLCHLIPLIFPIRPPQESVLSEIATLYDATATIAQELSHRIVVDMLSVVT